MKEIKMFSLVGNFAGNKDVARDIRMKDVMPALDGGEDVFLDFAGVESATQSFMHALISDVIRKKGIDILDRVYFKNCSETVKGIVNIVVDYMQA